MSRNSGIRKEYEQELRNQEWKRGEIMGQKNLSKISVIRKNTEIRI
jgi:hypothetical protein